MLRRSNRLAALVGLENLLGLEPAPIRGNQTEPSVIPAVFVEPVQQLDEAELANGCGAEPKDNLVVIRVMSQSGVTLIDLRATFPSPVTRAQSTQLAQCQVMGNWSHVECVTPRED